ncbi:ABC transporter substrate-binding protein [Streptomyces venezuelae]|uniref:ABC transporter substrate-binding protein n=1 Tax=Streptomyces venezuelae TaxID=54571 RepID=A0A5P2CT73_STRVZ|nr:MCE family protein [Streptomyces venezuelae]QES45490.1 ABC transporter substrate-binding protein [Streptomyces venezuelae]
MRLKPISERNPVAVALAGLLAMALVGLLAYNAESLPVIGGGTRYTADFKDSVGLKAGDEVRIAGVRVGKVADVALDGPKVKVTFEVEDAWIGDRSTVGIAIKTLLGAKYLAVDPLGSRKQDPGKRIPVARTTSPYDVMEAFNGLSRTSGALDEDRLAKSFEAISGAFKNTPPHVRKAMKGLSKLSRTVSTRNDELSELLEGSADFTTSLNSTKTEFERLLDNGNLLLEEVRHRRKAIHGLLTGARDLGTEISGLVDDNERRLGPTLAALDRVTDTLSKNKKNLDKALAAAGPYYRLVGNTLGNGRWMDGYLCGLVPDDYLPTGTAASAGTGADGGCMPPRPGGGR